MAAGIPKTYIRTRNRPHYKIRTLQTIWSGMAWLSLILVSRVAFAQQPSPTEWATSTAYQSSLLQNIVYQKIDSLDLRLDGDSSQKLSRVFRLMVPILRCFQSLVSDGARLSLTKAPVVSKPAIRIASDGTAGLRRCGVRDMRPIAASGAG